MCIILGFDPWISCIAYCVLHHYATSVHSTVILLVNTMYIFSKIYTGVSQYLLADVGRPARVLQLPGSGHDVTGPDMIDLNLPDAHVSSATCCKLLASGVQAGTDCRPSRCCAALSDSESARLGRGAARQQFTGVLDHDLFGCS